MPPADDAAFPAAVLAVLHSLRAGEVVSYGEVAAEAGFPGAARAVGNLLRATDEPVAWWRVVAATGRLAPGKELEQAARLRAEGVPVEGGRVVARRAASRRTAPSAGRGGSVPRTARTGAQR